MKTLAEQLTNYARYHRDVRNITTHLVGIPLIVLAIAILLSRPVLFNYEGLPLSPALFLCIGVLLYYLRLDLTLSLIMSAVFGLVLVFGGWIASQDTTTWLSIGLGSFAAGWAIQFIGHWYEGRRPAFVDDVVGLLIGPLFVVAELLFKAGWRLELEATIERHAGPVHNGSRGIAL